MEIYLFHILPWRQNFTLVSVQAHISPMISYISESLKTAMIYLIGSLYYKYVLGQTLVTSHAILLGCSMCLQCIAHLPYTWKCPSHTTCPHTAAYIFHCLYIELVNSFTV